jgi:hypothetical protein
MQWLRQLFSPTWFLRYAIDGPDEAWQRACRKHPPKEQPEIWHALVDRENPSLTRIRRLLDAGVDPNLPNHHGHTFLESLSLPTVVFFFHALAPLVEKGCRVPVEEWIGEESTEPVQAFLLEDDAHEARLEMLWAAIADHADPDELFDNLALLRLQVLHTAPPYRILPMAGMVVRMNRMDKVLDRLVDRPDLNPEQIGRWQKSRRWQQCLQDMEKWLSAGGTPQSPLLERARLKLLLAGEPVHQASLPKKRL